ncbi:MAG TPA: hypothetical protein QGF35_08630, partial [Dehalococcoidia bacterium]|nr:hypothetical protein [Dehalococcoidia bacterium]
MSADSAARSIEETLLFLELQLRELREAQTNSASEFEGLRRQVHELVKSDDERAHSIRETNARFTPLKGVPEGLRELGEDAEHIRTSISTTRAELENALRILQSEAGSDRDNRATTVKRIAEIAGALSSIASEMAQLQAQVSNVAQVTQSLIERQREAEAKVEQFGLRLDRTLEVHQDLEER